MVSNWLLKEFARARWSPRYLGIPIGKEVWGYLSDTERKPENSIPLKNPKNTASSTERACWSPKTMWRSTTRLTWSRNQKSISMITGVEPPDKLDKLESICGCRIERFFSTQLSCSLMLIPAFQLIELVQERINSFLHK